MGCPRAYASLRINTSRTVMEYQAYPMPKDYPDYPNHWEIQRYFESFVEHFKLAERITFRTRAERVAPAPDGEPGYDVTIRPLDRPDAPAQTYRYRWVLAASGHHWDPRWPEPAFPGEFDGQIMHSHDYKTPDFLVGKRVLVLGIGNSAADIAVEASRAAAATFLAIRRSAHVIPRYVLGRPADATAKSMSLLPIRIQELLDTGVLFLARGRVSWSGLPQPRHRVLQAHPTMSSDLLPAIRRGFITVKPNLAELQGDRVRFTDGSTEQVDVVIYCTGYKITFPFLDEEFFAAPDNQVRLFQRAVDPDRPGLYFVGLIQPLGAIMPLAELQSRWIAELILGEAALPGRAEMDREINGWADAMARRYVTSKRHTIEVDAFSYLRGLNRERRRGRRRASAARRAGASSRATDRDRLLSK
ncbi:MAG: NAD(P)-binding domain-containing protein [Sporichthyaceae bacterium]|nr:NAD(P)-binding domain-containing protein [Sporichthyaceae bacterium]